MTIDLDDADELRLEEDLDVEPVLPTGQTFIEIHRGFVGKAAGLIGIERLVEVLARQRAIEILHDACRELFEKIRDLPMVPSSTVAELIQDEVPRGGLADVVKEYNDDSDS